MSDPVEEDLYETTIIEAKYAQRIDRGMALSLFDFPDIDVSAGGPSRNIRSTQQLQSADRTQSLGTDDHYRKEAPDGLGSTGDRSLLSLPPEIRDRIWRFVLGNLDNAPASVQCRHCYPPSRHDLLARASRNPRLCFGLQSSVKIGKFPSLLVMNRQVCGEAIKLLYAGRSFTFCTWSCYAGWVQRLLERDSKGGELMLSLLTGVTIHMDMQNGYRRSETAKEWAKVVQESIEQMFSKQMKVQLDIVEPTLGNQLIVSEARLKFSLREIPSRNGK